MKILRLDLEAFGSFTDCTLDLSAGDHGLHLIHGGNEAGKSVTKRAIQGLLFGIPTRTTDTFLHENKALRIGGKLRNDDGATIEFIRRKGNSKTILNPHAKNAAMPADALAPFLKGTDGDTFQKVYGIGHAELEEGGRELQRLQGLAGESLFAAGLGVVGLSKMLDSLAEDAKDLFEGRTNSRSSIRVAMKERQALLKSAREATVPETTWKGLRRDVERLEERLAQTVEDLRASRQRRAACERLRSTLNFVGRRDAVLAELAKLEAVLTLPAEYSAGERADCERLLRAARDQRRELALELEGDDGLEAQIAAIQIPERLLGSAKRISTLQETLGAYRNFQEDLPKRMARRRTLGERGATLLQELGAKVSLQAAEGLLPGKDLVVGIRSLAGGEQRVRAEPTKLARQVVDVRQEIEAKRMSLEALPEPRQIGPLTAATERILKAGDLEERLRSAQGKVAAKRIEAERQRSALGLFSGDTPPSLEELEALPIPPQKTLERFQAQFAALDTERRRLDDAADEQRRKLLGATIELDALQRDGQVPTVDDLRAARAERERGWALVRSSWLDGDWDGECAAAFTGGSADAESERASLGDRYERCVEGADEIADRLRDDADLTAKIESLRGQVADREAELLRLATASTDLDRRRATLQSEWSSIWTAVGIDKSLPPPEMLEWRQRVHGVLDVVAALHELSESVAADERLLAKHGTELGRLLLASGERAAPDGETLASKLDRATAAIASNSEAMRARQTLQEAISDAAERLTRLERQQQDAESDLDDWKARWATALGILGCDANASSLQVYARIDSLAELGKVLSDIADLDQRIEAMTAKQEHFEREVEELSGLLVEQIEPMPAEQMAALLNQRVSAAREAQVLAGRLEKELNEKTRAATQAKEREAAASSRLKTFCALAKVDSPADLPAAERASDEKLELERRLGEIDENLLAIGGGASVEELLAEARGKDPSTVEAESKELDDKIHADEQRQREESGDLEAKKRELQSIKGSADAAVADEHALGLLGKIQEDARQHIRLRLARELLRHQIERNRAETENPMIKRASELFARLTCRSFSGLMIDYGSGDEQLIVGVRSRNGEHVGPEGMSDGTADQLYLALRLAYLETQLEHGERMPLIVDDILVDFDDGRAAATLKVLGELATKTQVLFLTHHIHLRDLARSVVPDEMRFEHALPSPGRGVAADSDEAGPDVPSDAIILS